MQHKDTIVKNTCLDYVVEQLPKEIDRYNRICDTIEDKQQYNLSEKLQWNLVIHLTCVFKTLIVFDIEAYTEYKELFEMIDEFEKEK